MNDNVLMVAENDIIAGQLESLKALILEMSEVIQRDEPGTLNYEWYIAEDSKSAHAFERYTDSETCLHHLMSMRQQYGERLFACLTITKITVYGNPSAQLRELFAGAAPIYGSRFAGVARYVPIP